MGACVKREVVEKVRRGYLQAVLRVYRRCQWVLRSLSSVGKAYPSDLSMIFELQERVEELAKSMRKEFTEIVEALRIWNWMGRIAGIGPYVAGFLLSEISWDRVENPGAVWAYCGLAPRESGVRYNREAKFVVCTKLVNMVCAARHRHDEATYYYGVYEALLREEEERNERGDYRELARRVYPGGGRDKLLESHLVARARLRWGRVFLSHLFTVTGWELDRRSVVREPLGPGRFPVPYLSREQYLSEQCSGVSLRHFYYLDG